LKKYQFSFSAKKITENKTKSIAFIARAVIGAFD